MFKKTPLPRVPQDPLFYQEIERLLDSQIFSDRGPLVQRFEGDIREFLGNPRLGVVTCANATLGLQLALQAYRVRGKVIVPAFTSVATVHAITQAGLEPVFADIDPDTFCLSPDSLQENLSREVRAVVPVHIFGTLCDTEAFDWLKKKRIKVIFDSTHAFAVKRTGKFATGFGDAEVYSFNSRNAVHSFEGGAVASDDHDFCARFREMTQWGTDSNGEVDCQGTNAKLSEIHALMGIYSLRKLQVHLQNRKQVEKAYQECLNGFDAIRLIPPPAGVEGNAQFFPVLIENETLRDKLFTALKEGGIPVTREFAHPVHELKPYRNTAHQPLPVAEAVAKRILCLPIANTTTEEDVAKLTQAVRIFFGAGRRAKAA